MRTTLHTPREVRRSAENRAGDEESRADRVSRFAFYLFIGAVILSVLFFIAVAIAT